MPNSEATKKFFSQFLVFGAICLLFGIPVYGIILAVDKHSAGVPIPANKIVNITISITLAFLLFNVLVGNYMTKKNTVKSL